jgi:hyperosmotically inducible periplasmic protein
MNKSTIFTLLLSGTLAGQVVAQTAADNSKANQASGSNAAVTADGQSNSAADIDLTKRIRQGVMADKSLSTYAHNVKIVTNRGQVTLSGVVRTEAEKSTVEMKAADVAGKQHVTSDIKVSPSK